MRALLPLALVLFGAQCTREPQQEPTTPPLTGELCDDSCAEGARLGCAWAGTGVGPDGRLGTVDDSTCVERCRYFTDLGVPWEHDGCR